MQVSRGTSGNPLHEAWLTAGQQAGYPLTEDMNGYQQEGVGRMDATIYKVMPQANYEKEWGPSKIETNLKIGNEIIWMFLFCFKLCFVKKFLILSSKWQNCIFCTNTV